MWTTASTIQNMAFYPCPIDELAVILSINRHGIDKIYREAYEQARQLHGPPITDRLAPSLN
jgi:hypothetical protein